MTVITQKYSLLITLVKLKVKKAECRMSIQHLKYLRDCRLR